MFQKVKNKKKRCHLTSVRMATINKKKKKEEEEEEEKEKNRC